MDPPHFMRDLGLRYLLCLINNRALGIYVVHHRLLRRGVKDAMSGETRSYLLDHFTNEMHKTGWCNKIFVLKGMARG